MENVFEEVVSVIVEEIGVDREKVTPTASIVDDLGADSLDVVELVMQLEERFGIEVPDDDATDLVTVQDVVDYVAKERSRS